MKCNRLHEEVFAPLVWNLQNLEIVPELGLAKHTPAAS